MMQLVGEVQRILTKLWKLQEADPPAILWEGLATLARMALFGLLLLAAFLLVQTIISAIGQDVKRLLVLGACFLITTLVPIWSLAEPLKIAPPAPVASITLQTPTRGTDGAFVWGNDKVLPAQAADKIEALLTGKICRRTLRQSLPVLEKDMYNMVVALEGGAQYQLMLTPHEGVRYETETLGFLSKVQQYDELYKTLQTYF